MLRAAWNMYLQGQTHESFYAWPLEEFVGNPSTSKRSILPQNTKKWKFHTLENRLGAKLRIWDGDPRAFEPMSLTDDYSNLNQWYSLEDGQIWNLFHATIVYSTHHGSLKARWELHFVWSSQIMIFPWFGGTHMLNQFAIDETTVTGIKHLLNLTAVLERSEHHSVSPYHFAEEIKGT